MRFAEGGRPSRVADPNADTAALLETFRVAIDDRTELQALSDAARSDAYWMAHEFGIEHDEAGLFCERNVLRYRALPDLVVRIGLGATVLEWARALLALRALGSAAAVSVHPDAEIAGMDVLFREVGPPGADVVRESPAEFKARMASRGVGRVRLLGSEDGLSELSPAVHVDARPTVVSGRVELLRYLREQTVSTTEHRFGSPVSND
jgi:RHH-type proline utilization regulon transcriptional repressor/proline dehydrogenase/delta 1-pyrroline-5-carboxylate dehydrogenase